MADLTITMDDAAAAGSGAPGSRTRAEIFVMLKKMLKRSGTGDDVVMGYLLNLSQKEIARMYEWSCLRRIISGTLSTGVTAHYWPDQLKKVRALKLTGDNDRKLWPMSQEEVAMEFPDLSEVTEAVPTRYVNLGLYYYPIAPSDDNYPYELEYDKWPADMTSDNDTSELEHMEDLLLYYSAMHCALQFGLKDDHATYKTMIYSEARVGRGVRGLLQQARALDTRFYEARAIRRPFTLGYGKSRSSNYMSNPMEGLR